MRISTGERLSVEQHAYLYGREIVSGATCVSLRERDCQWSNMRISTGERLSVERHAYLYGTEIDSGATCVPLQRDTGVLPHSHRGRGLSNI